MPCDRRWKVASNHWYAWVEGRDRITSSLKIHQQKNEAPLKRFRLSFAGRLQNASFVDIKSGSRRIYDHTQFFLSHHFVPYTFKYLPTPFVKTKKILRTVTVLYVQTLSNEHQFHRKSKVAWNGEKLLKHHWLFSFDKQKNFCFYKNNRL